MEENRQSKETAPNREPFIERDVGVLQNNIRVIDRPHTHISLENSFRTIVRRALEKISVSESDPPEHVVVEVDLGEIIGARKCVPTKEGDEIIYARRFHRHGLSRFVKYTQPLFTQTMTVVLLRKADAPVLTYILITAYIGPKAAYEPWDHHATAADRAFWKTNAYFYNPEDIIPGTELSEAEYLHMQHRDQ